MSISNLILILLGAILIFYKKIVFKQKFTNLKIQSLDNISPQTTIFTFDIHGVLFELDYKKICRLIGQNKRALTCFFYFLYPPFLLDFIKLKNKRAVPEEYIMKFCKKYPGLDQHKNLAIAIANAQKPIKSSVNIVKQLKEKGYTLHIFSNIGATIFENLQAIFPEIFGLFDTHYTPSNETGYFGKPKQEAFVLYNTLCNVDNKKVIFIDNSVKNIERALQNNMHGIVYKKDQDLCSQLESLKIL